MRKAIKEANKARYRSLTEQGINKKSKRVKLRSKRAKRLRANRDKHPCHTSMIRQEELRRKEKGLLAAKEQRQRDMVVEQRSRVEKKMQKQAKDKAVWESYLARRNQ